MIHRHRGISVFLFSLALGLALGCDKDKKETETPSDDDNGGNLCTDYKTCDECIAGQQAKKGVSKGAAETECGAAVIGCWTTWEKPVICGGKEHTKEE